MSANKSNLIQKQKKKNNDNYTLFVKQIQQSTLTPKTNKQQLRARAKNRSSTTVLVQKKAFHMVHIIELVGQPKVEFAQQVTVSIPKK